MSKPDKEHPLAGMFGPAGTFDVTDPLIPSHVQAVEGGWVFRYKDGESIEVKEMEAKVNLAYQGGTLDHAAGRLARAYRRKKLGLD